MDLMGTAEQVKLTDDSSEYLAVYRYGGKYYLVGFTLQRSEKGWHIVSMSANSKQLENGTVKRIKQKDMERLLES